MLIVSKDYNSMRSIFQESSDNDFNWYSVRAKNVKGSIIIEFHMSVKDDAEGMNKAYFFEEVKHKLENNESQWNNDSSNLEDSHDYDKFEISALKYLNRELGTDAFRRIGGNNGKLSDLVLRCDNTFWVECKMNPEARAGQFTVKATEEGITLNTVPIDVSDKNVDVGDKKLFSKSLANFVTATQKQLKSIFDKCNKDPLEFFNYISQEEQIQINAGKTDIVSYVKAHYMNKKVKYFITGKTNNIDDCIIVPLKNLENVFNIEAICRFKRYNARVVPGRYSDKVMEMIYSALKNGGYSYNVNSKWYKNYGAVYVKSDKDSFDIKVSEEDATKYISIEKPMTLVFDKKDSAKISNDRQPARKK